MWQTTDGEQINIEIIRNFMRDKLHCDVAHTTLWRALQRWGFEFGKGTRSAQLKESEQVQNSLLKRNISDTFSLV